MKKLFTLLTMLIVAITSSWAANETANFIYSGSSGYDAATGSGATKNNITIVFSGGSHSNSNGGYWNVSAQNTTITITSTKTNITSVAITHTDGSRSKSMSVTTGTGTITGTAGTDATLTYSNTNAEQNIVLKYTASGARVTGIVVTYTGDAPATQYTVTFNAGTNGTCATTSLKEAEAGAGVTLPEVTPNSGYVFNGWFTAATGGDKAGDAGDNYKPSADNTPLYAQYTEIPTPTFELSATSIEVGQTAQIKVIGKDDLDGVTLTDLTYDDTKISIDANGVVTPSVAGGPYAISFNSSAVDGKYKASSGNLSITVTAPKCATPTISPVSFSTDNQEVTITSETVGATIYYTTNGATPSTSSLVYDSENKPTISSTTTFKAIAVKENYDDSEVATQKVTRTSSAVVASWNFTNWSSETQAGVRADGTNWRDYETSKTDKPLNDKVYSNKEANATFVYSETTIPETKGLSFATTAYTFGLAFDQASTSLGTYHGSEYLWLYGGNSVITIPSLSAGSTIEIGLESHKINGTDDATRTLTVTNTNEGSYSTEAYTEQTFTVTADGDVTIYPSKGMHIYYITVTGNAETVPVSTVGSNNYATYVTESNLDFSSVSDEITAYIATADNGSTITTEAVTEVPTGTALLIKTANAGSTVNVPVAASTPATLTANKLKFSNESLVINEADATAKRYYGFFKVGEKYGFAPMKAGTLAAKKAYLEYESNTLQFIALDLEDAPTAIDFVEAENNANSAAPIKVIKNGKLYIGNYNVAGQQVK